MQHEGVGDMGLLGVIPATQQQVKGLLESAANPAMREIAGGLISNIALRKNEQQAKPSFNNPGNIRNVSKTPKKNWTGSVPGIGYQGGEVVANGKHAIFTSPVLGLRALFRDVGSKITEFEGDLAAIITKFAPPKDNNPTKSYIETLREELELKDGEMVTEDHLSKLVKAIVEFENDDQALIDLYLSDEVFNEAKKLSKHSLDGRGDLAAAQREHELREMQLTKNPYKQQ
jgi:hypothetical protein